MTVIIKTLCAADIICFSLSYEYAFACVHSVLDSCGLPISHILKYMIRFLKSHGLCRYYRREVDILGFVSKASSTLSSADVTSCSGASP